MYEIDELFKTIKPDYSFWKVGVTFAGAVMYLGYTLSLAIYVFAPASIVIGLIAFWLPFHKSNSTMKKVKKYVSSDYKESVRLLENHIQELKFKAKNEETRMKNSKQSARYGGFYRDNKRRDQIILLRELQDKIKNRYEINLD